MDDVLLILFYSYGLRDSVVSEWIKQGIIWAVHPVRDISRVDTRLDELSTTSDADIFALQAAVQQQIQRRQD